MAKAEAARTFAVSLKTVKNYVARQRTTGSLAPRPKSGRPPRIRPAQEGTLVDQLHAASDATLAEHVAQWAKTTGVRMSLATMSRAIRRVGWTRKKRPLGPPNVTSRSVPRGASGSRRSIRDG